MGLMITLLWPLMYWKSVFLINSDGVIVNDFKIKTDITSNYNIEGVAVHDLSNSISSGVQHEQLNIVKVCLEELFAGLAWFG